MKQYVKDGEGTKIVPLPVVYHLKQAVGALTLHTGRNYMYKTMGIKNANGKVGEPRRLFQMVDIANMGDFFETSKGKHKKASAKIKVTDAIRKTEKSKFYIKQ